MRVLLTGATGLVGARLLPRLLGADIECRTLIRRGRTIPDGAIAFEGDLFNQETLVRAVKDVLAVVHLAAVFRTADDDLIWRSNVEGTRNLVAVTKKHAPNARFIMASTSNVYNRASQHPGRETDTVDPKKAYPASKVVAETELRKSGLKWSILRFPFVYGEGDGHLEMLPQHLDRFGFQPAHRLSTVHHRDIATAVSLALTGAFDGRIVNISDDAPTTVYELVHLAGAQMNSSSEPLIDPWFLHIDASLARSLGFRPIVRSVYQAVQDGLL